MPLRRCFNMHANSGLNTCLQTSAVDFPWVESKLRDFADRHSARWFEAMSWLGKVDPATVLKDVINWMVRLSSLCRAYNLTQIRMRMVSIKIYPIRSLYANKIPATIERCGMSFCNGSSSFVTLIRHLSTSPRDPCFPFLVFLVCFESVLVFKTQPCTAQIRTCSNPNQFAVKLLPVLADKNESKMKVLF